MSDFSDTVFFAGDTISVEFQVDDVYGKPVEYVIKGFGSKEFTSCDSGVAQVVVGSDICGYKNTFLEIKVTDDNLNSQNSQSMSSVGVFMNSTKPLEIDYGYSICEISENEYMMLGSNYLIKFNNKGHMTWNKSIDLQLDNPSIYKVTNNEFIIMGTSEPTEEAGRKSVLINIDSIGNIKWQKEYSNQNDSYDIVYSVTKTFDNGYLLATSSRIPGGNNVVGVFIKTDRNGDVEWKKAYGEVNQMFLDTPMLALQTLDNDYIFSSITKNKIWIVKVNSVGDELFEIILENEFAINKINAMSITNDNSIILASLKTNGVCLLSKIDRDGTIIWDKEYDMGDAININTIIETSDNGYIVVGETREGNRDIFMIKTDIDGSELWRSFIGGREWDTGNGIIETSDGGYIISGTMYNSNEMRPFASWFKTDAKGNTVLFE